MVPEEVAASNSDNDYAANSDHQMGGRTEIAQREGGGDRYQLLGTRGQTHKSQSSVQMARAEMERETVSPDYTMKVMQGPQRNRTADGMHPWKHTRKPAISRSESTTDMENPEVKERTV